MSLQTKNKINPIYLVVIFFVMLGLSYASVPLYELFCKVTGFGGTTKVAKQVPNIIINHNITTRFDTNVAKGLFWEFKSEKIKENIKPGHVSTVKFKVKNLVELCDFFIKDAKDKLNLYDLNNLYANNVNI